MRIFGHRGAAGHAPENTLEGIRTGLTLGVDGIEFDVRCSKDHRPVVIHDETIDRTTSGSGTVDELTLKELSAFGIPSLGDVLQLVGDQVHQNVELKELAAARLTYDLLTELFKQHLLQKDKILVTSFDWDAVRLIRQLDSSIPVGLLTKGIPADEFWRLSRELRSTTANINLASVTPQFVETAHTYGMMAMVYTVNTAEDGQRMHEMEVDAVFSDYPDRLRS